MIELTFGRSTAVALKIAKSIENGTLIRSTERNRPGVLENYLRPAYYIGGSSKEVEALELELDMGDISGMDADIAARKKALVELYAAFPRSFDKRWESVMQTIRRLQEAKKTLEPIRMWICNSDPAEVCGLYFVCHMLVDAEMPISVIRIPSEIEKEDCIVSYGSTGEMGSEDLGSFTKYEEEISQLKRSVYAHVWSDLVRENAPLRAIVNGSVISVPADFYDFALRANIREVEPIKIGRLIGEALGKAPGAGDEWLFSRIQKMIQSGELIEVSKAEEGEAYSAIVKRNYDFKK